MRSIAALLLFATPDTSGLAVSRRRFVAAAVPLVVTAPALAAAAPAEADLVKDLVKAKASLEELPKMVGAQSWDAVRNELRQPAVNALWNTMDSGNTLRKLAKARGDGDIIEAAEDVARNLRDVDQMVYGNAFSMEGKMAGAGLRGDGSGVGGKGQGEGGGKYRIKEPQELLRVSVRALDDVIAAASL
tara:strand:- start:107 stop:670 length:564 start_codon:yes stop_codon:yes gene_type:complete